MSQSNAAEITKNDENDTLKTITSDTLKVSSFLCAVIDFS